MTIYKNGVQARIGKEEMEITADKLLKGAGVGADPTEIDEFKATIAYIVSDDLRNSNDAERSSGLVSWEKKKETKLNANLPPNGACRVKFDLRSGGAGSVVYGRIYKNGVAIGTEQSSTSTAYATFSEDFTGFVSGDLIQVYIYGADSIVYTRNLRFYYHWQTSKLSLHPLVNPLAVTSDPTISMTNQDP